MEGDDSEQQLAEEPTLSRAAVRAASEAERPQIIEDFLKEQLSRVLRISSDELNVHQPLNNLGIDSLMAVELRNHVQASLDIVIPVAQLLQDPSIAQLGQNILDQLEEIVPQDMEIPVGVGNEVIDAVAKETGLSAEKALERLDEMSDSEVEAMLGQMLDGQEE